MGKGVRLARIALVGAFFGPAEVALPDTGPEAQPAVRALTVSDIVIPPDLGYVIERYEPTTNPHPNPLIVHIQDAHANEEAQRRIAQLLERLIQERDLKLILLEGGQGDVGLRHLRAYGTPENRKAMAEKYLRLGVLGGAEYLDIAADYPLTLWGVERRLLLREHMALFLEIEPAREALRPALASIRRATDALKGRLVEPQLLALEADHAAFEEGRMGLPDFAAHLADLARRHGVALATSPNIERLVDVSELERTIHLDQVEQEQGTLLGRLRTAAPPEVLERLKTMAQEVQAGTRSHEAFYTRLAQHAKDAQVPPAAYPELSRYVRYLAEQAALDVPSLSNELEALVLDLRGRLAGGPQARQLLAVIDHVSLVEDLVELGLSPGDYERLKSVEPAAAVAQWEPILGALFEQQGLPNPLSGDEVASLSAGLPRFLRFYELARQRDEAIVEHVLAKLTETGEPLAALVTGGFHSPQVTRLLKARGVGLVVVVPKVGEVGEPRLYDAVMRYMGGRGGLEEVEALVHGETQ